MHFAMSYSFGKDSALALWRLVQQGHTPVCLITTFNAEAGRSWFHGVPRPLMEAVAQSMGIPLLACACTGEDYHLRLEEALAEARAMGAEACAFGDIDIQDHLDWNRQRCASVGLSCQMPLWQQEREAVVRACVDEGFKAVIKCVQNEYLPLLGRTLDAETLALIRSTGADLCGENGEYHTFVYDGPLFSQPVPIAPGPPVDIGTHSVVEVQHASAASV